MDDEMVREIEKLNKGLDENVEALSESQRAAVDGFLKSQMAEVLEEATALAADPVVADEIVSDANLALCRNLLSFDTYGPYVFRLAMRRRRKQKAKPVSEDNFMPIGQILAPAW